MARRIDSPLIALAEDSMALTDKARTLLEMVYRVGAPRFHELTVGQARHSFEKLQFAFGGERVPVASVTEVPMARPDGSALLARLYRPLRGDALDDNLPLVVFFHGGGWCIGDVASYDGYCRRLANASHCAVLSVDYRLAPEHPFPAAVVDAYFALEWAVEHALLLGIDPQRIAVAGDSAGGTLSIVTALAARDAAGPAISFLALVYPCTEIVSDRASRDRYGDGYFLDRESLTWFFERYLGISSASDWRASPALAPSLAGLPPIALVTAECDPLTDDCLAFAKRVMAEGGEVEHIGVPGMIHGFATLMGLFSEAQDTLDMLALRIRSALYGG